MRDIPVVSLLHLSETQVQNLASAAPGLVVSQHTVHRGEDPSPYVGDAEVVLAWGVDFPLAAAPHLRWVQLASAGVDDLLANPIMQTGIQLTTAAGVAAPAAGEHVLALMMAWARQLPLTARWQTSRYWPDSRRKEYRVTELRGSTVGIVGFGNIGREVGRLCRCLGMRVLAVRRGAGQPAGERWREPGSDGTPDNIAERVLAPGELPAMLPECDWVVIAAPLTPATRASFGARELAAMKPSAYLINVSRGEVADQSALIAALQAHAIAGAALDVFDGEPLAADNPLWALENVIVTPHVASQSPRYNQRLAALFADNLARYAGGKRLLNLVGRERGY